MRKVRIVTTQLLVNCLHLEARTELLFFCSSVPKKEILPTLRSVRMTLCA